MVDIFEITENVELAGVLLKLIEQKTRKEIFTLRILEKNNNDQSLDSVIVFKDRSVLMGKIGVFEVNGSLACRIQGNYI